MEFHAKTREFGGNLHSGIAFRVPSFGFSRMAKLNCRRTDERDLLDSGGMIARERQYGNVNSSQRFRRPDSMPAARSECTPSGPNFLSRPDLRRVPNIKGDRSATGA